jgi:hypothetical protein
VEGRAGDVGVMLKGMVDKHITISGKQTYLGKSCFFPTYEYLSVVFGQRE